MNFEILGPLRLKVTLTEQELMGYGISFEDMSTENKQTRELIEDVLSIAKVRTGFTKGERGSVFVKTHPCSKGCVMYFSIVSEYPDKTAISLPAVYITESAETVLCVSQKLYEKNADAAVYHNSDGYIFIAGQEKNSDVCEMVLSEYCRLCGRGDCYAASVKEHSVLLCQSAREAGRRVTPQDNLRHSYD